MQTSFDVQASDNAKRKISSTLLGHLSAYKISLSAEGSPADGWTLTFSGEAATVSRFRTTFGAKIRVFGGVFVEAAPAPAPTVEDAFPGEWLAEVEEPAAEASAPKPKKHKNK